MEESMNCTVYRIDINNHSYYGYSKEFEERIKRHRKDLERGIHHNIVLQRLWNKYQILEYEILADGLAKSDAHSLEKKLIAENECINIARGGDGGDTITRHPNRDEIIAKISKNHCLIYSDEWKKSQGTISEWGDIVWGIYHCNVCDRDIKCKTNYIRYHGDKCGKPKKTYECPHCGKIGFGGGMFRDHFDRCKSRI